MDDEEAVARLKISTTLVRIGLHLARLEEAMADGASSDRMNSDARIVGDLAVVLASRIDALARIEELARQEASRADRDEMAVERAAGA